MVDLEYLKDFAVDFARNAGEQMRADFKKGVGKEIKEDGSIVTSTDKVINSNLISAIKREFPYHEVLSEEGNYLNKSNMVWICDPVDGTSAFYNGLPTFSFSLAFTVSGIALVGVVYEPISDRMYYAVESKGSFMNGEKISVSKDKSIKGSAFGFCYWAGAQTNPIDLQRLHASIIGKGGAVFMPGSIVCNGSRVAAGKFAASFHPAIDSHDSAALDVIICEAGGKVTDLEGNKIVYDGRKIKGALMSNGIIHESLLSMIRGSA